MEKNIFRTIAFASLALVVVLGATSRAQAQTPDAKSRYPSMAPLDQYLMADRDVEIGLARSAAPKAISQDAEVMLLGRHGYETVVKGKNNFVCMVERSWTAGIDAPDFGIPGCVHPSASTRRPHTPIFQSQSRRLSLY